MFRASFLAPEASREELLDALLPLLPAGVREDGDVVWTLSGSPPDRAALEAACGRTLEGWKVEEVPADWRRRRALEGGGGIVVAGRVAIRSPWDTPPADGIVDVVVERNGVAVSCAVADLATDPVPLASLLLVNAPPPVHERVAASAQGQVRHVIVSGIVKEEVEAVLTRYRAAGFEVANALGTEDEWIALRLSS